MHDPTPQDWLTLSKRLNAMQPQLARLLAEVEAGRVLTPDEQQQLDELLIVVRNATKQAQALERRLQRLKHMADQAPNN